MTGSGAATTTDNTVVDFSVSEDEGASKVVELDDAIREFVRAGDTIHVAYSDARPNAALMALGRVFRGTDPQFTLVTAGLVSIQHSLIELGLIRKLVASFAGENFPVARPNPALVRAISNGDVEIEHWSLWSLLARLTAGSLGVSHYPVKSMRGSSMGDEAAARGELIDLPRSDGDSGTSLVSALRPDVVLLHGAVADRAGNVVLAAPYGEGQVGALAAKRGVIVTVERIVSTEEIRKMNTRTRIPAHVVRAVCEVPFGAHPFGFNNPGVPGLRSYSEDLDFVLETLEACKSPETFAGHIEKWVTGPSGPSDYRSLLGESRLEALVRSDVDSSATRIPVPSPVPPATALEQQVIVTSRVLNRSVIRSGHHAILAGVGLSNLAAWVGAKQLKAQGIDVALMAEIGLFDYSPLPGEPFIFAGQNVPTNKLLTDVKSVLGTYVSGPGTSTVGLVGAGQIDKTGAINSTYSEDGRFIVGSGGANDVLSGAEEVIVTVSHGPTRLVESVPYITSPGARVRTIVTELCVFDRSPETGEFVLTALQPAAGDSIAEAIREVRARTGFDFDVADTVEFESGPSDEELVTLRAFDPQRFYLRDR
ncbi:acyl CoA:acetate/3-ketoacid CoA transferase alpha subunit/acyl CoA:acetate/3-ketoacid CoA transferase beta subunit [Rhodococcus sp. 27YEA15]|uniref:CoA-transferase n=1 Tax=Rhodococcus sp. 27YEA15 TaxID=3156259 RepID=UPI003C7C5324